MAEQGNLTRNQNNWLEWANNIITLADLIEKIIQCTDIAEITDEISGYINTVAIRNKLGSEACAPPTQISKEEIESTLLKRR
jgi:hypothetical protein